MIQRAFWGAIYALAIFWICNAKPWSPILLVIPLFGICLEFVRMNKLKTPEKIIGITYVSLTAYSIWSIWKITNENSISIIFIIFVLIWISDSMAYLGGKLIGRSLLAPSLSPNKTWEGAIVGSIFTLISGIWILVKIDAPLSEFSSPESWQRVTWALPLTISIIAPIGDLVGSKFKRLAKVKDSGVFLPGHGGFLDRFDSFLLSIIVVSLLQSNILIS
ncbi:MAG: Phosphatidate cytidylyltransferase [Owenweeksia sp. TMED14]|nr:MAG: Phosphatidate cytidylyltransferase [Owenweeksia sp. TMED14]|tara:strand:- start:7710 stop:8366 length:657 start_codon:yes stop_codon:yes gene_type:complete